MSQKLDGLLYDALANSKAIAFDTTRNTVATEFKYSSEQLVISRKRYSMVWRPISHSARVHRDCFTS